MDINEIMVERNARFAETEFAPELKMLPSTGTIVVGCVDPRVDPALVLGLKQGEAAVIRNVGGRVAVAAHGGWERWQQINRLKLGASTTFNT